MGLSTAWLEWLVLGGAQELMLFAAVGVLLIGLDDLLFDAMWLAMRRAPPSEHPRTSQLTGPLAVFVPAWEEAKILPAMLRRTLAAWAEDDFVLYVGCYPNDAATIFAVAPLVARDRRLRLVISDSDGPTTKGDNLNRLWAAMCEDERADDMRFAGIVLHDAEDHVHECELALHRAHLVDNAMVQIPVVPLMESGSHWIGGHYGDEFAEAHGKELVVRSRLGVPLPSAGVGCALSRSAMALLAIERGGDPFRRDSLTEDYEVGMLLGAYGLRARFVDTIGRTGTRVVSRGAFPGRVDAAVRQKARWVAGIALAGWDHLGWHGSRQGTAGLSVRRRWLARWMLWRDRRALLAALILLAAYGGLIATALGMAGQALLGWRPIEPVDALRWLLALNAMILLWRLGMRGHFTARWYGLRQALLALPRALVANIVAMLAARRAVVLYWQMLQSGRVVWDKTEHFDHDVAAEAAPVSIAAR